MEEKLRLAREALAEKEAEIERLQNEQGTGGRGNNNVTANVSAMYRQPKVATFSRKNSLMWFAQAEITLRNAGITTASTKADFLAEKLDMEAFQAVHDLLTIEPRPADIFNQVKTRLVATYGSSAESRLRQLLKGQVSTCGKPSLILSRLRALDAGSPTDVVRTVFLDQLPAPCRAALSISDITDLNKLAEMAQVR